MGELSLHYFIRCHLINHRIIYSSLSFLVRYYLMHKCMGYLFGLLKYQAKTNICNLSNLKTTQSKKVKSMQEYIRATCIKHVIAAVLLQSQKVLLLNKVNRLSKFQMAAAFCSISANGRGSFKKTENVTYCLMVRIIRHNFWTNVD